MQKRNEYIEIGKIVASTGLQGDVIITHELNNNQKPAIEVLFIEMQKGSYIPYFIQKIKPINEGEWQVKFEELNNRTEAQTYIKKKVWISKADFDTINTESSFLQLLGYKLFDNKTYIGTIDEVIQMPFQTLAKIMIAEKEALIPIHDQNIIKLLPELKEIYVTIPDGLLDVYQ